MELLWEMAQLLVSLALILVSLLACVVIFAVDARKHNNAHVDASVIFEDPNSLKQVPCPHVHDSADKYISLIIPAFNEEHRLPGALDEALRWVEHKNCSFCWSFLCHYLKLCGQNDLYGMIFIFNVYILVVENVCGTINKPCLHNEPTSTWSEGAISLQVLLPINILTMLIRRV
uniref:Dolichyl-phosphate beta-glucosyltransferase-like isoform X2 n=1 Tax=Rhizophora mucronata TaxID=61149 RepID=A0A2P2LSG2_RHIMU